MKKTGIHTGTWILSGVLLCSCAASTPENQVVAEKPKISICAAAQYRELIGQPIDQVHTADLPKPLRVYSVHSLITKDYRPERMNVVVGVDGRVISVECG